jgi:hypothetical protein
MSQTALPVVQFKEVYPPSTSSVLITLPAGGG